MVLTDARNLKLALLGPKGTGSDGLAQFEALVVCMNAKYKNKVTWLFSQSFKIIFKMILSSIIEMFFTHPMQKCYSFMHN